MATTPPIHDPVKISTLLDTARKIPLLAQALTDAIKNPDGGAVTRYNELHKLVLALKDQVNGIYGCAGNADRSTQTGKRKEKPEKAEADKPPEKKQRHVEGVKYLTKAERRAARTEQEPPMTEGSSDDP